LETQFYKQSAPIPYLHLKEFLHMGISTPSYKLLIQLPTAVAFLKWWGNLA
jgi:hypothetical protein